MRLITKVKAGSISSLSDARFFAGIGVDWMGFNVNTDSPSYVNVQLYRDIVGWITGPLRIVELADNHDQEVIHSIINDYLPDFVEVKSHQLQYTFKEKKVFVRSSITNDDVELIKRFEGKIEGLIIQPDTTQEKIVELVDNLNTIPNILLSVQPDLYDPKRVISEMPITGIALQGSQELRPGIKVYDYSDLLESLESDD